MTKILSLIILSSLICQKSKDDIIIRKFIKDLEKFENIDYSDEVASSFANRSIKSSYKTYFCNYMKDKYGLFIDTALYFSEKHKSQNGVSYIQLLTFNDSTMHLIGLLYNDKDIVDFIHKTMEFKLYMDDKLKVLKNVFVYTGGKVMNEIDSCLDIQLVTYYPLIVDTCSYNCWPPIIDTSYKRNYRLCPNNSQR